MLIHLSVKNVAVIKELDIDMKNGVTVLTGETGAGKSIIIDSVNMILGERASKEIVRYGEDSASVQAVFDNIPKNVTDALCENDIETEDGEIIISRRITAEGKSTARINGCVVPLSFLRSIASDLINIHGQHDNQALLTPSKHMAFLDDYAADGAELEKYREIYKKTKALKREIESLEVDEQTKQQRIDLLEYQIKEIAAANLTSGEEEELKEQRDIYANFEKINEASETAYDNLYGGENAQSAYDGISRAVSALAEIADYDPALRSVYDALSSAMYAVEDSSHELKEFNDGIEYDEQTLNDIEARLDLISKLKRKYGKDINEILEYLNKASAELAAIKTSDESLAELNAEYQKSKERLLAAGEELSRVRTEKAKELGAEITRSIHELNMENAALEVALTNDSVFHENGINTAEFMIRTNPGEPMKPLAKIASGGELSRVILAIKSIFADGVDTMIFDEIDTGVSGAAAMKITQKLVKIGRNKQVICITHLPQLAAAADTHYLIVKGIDGDMASTTLRELDAAERERELARIIDGSEISEIALSHAKQMLENAKKL
ncbi:MAG: DNA repair protein RecN [Firmicutes bacterium]|nr:DNA repair protein RecN [Bacillota bacterium]